MQKNLRIITFTYNIPRPDKTSGERRFVAILNILAKYHQVHLCVSQYGKWLFDKECQYYAKELEKLRIKVLPFKKNIVVEALSTYNYDIGIFEFYWIAEETLSIFRRFQPEALTIVDSVDVAFAREETAAKLNLIKESDAKKTKKRELKIYKKADATIAVSSLDHDILANQEGLKNVFIVPNVVPIFARNEKKRKPQVVFIGSYIWPPNVDAVNWFVKEIWPTVYRKDNKAEFLIIGSDVTDEINMMSKLPGVEVLGYVPDTKPYLDSASVSVAPLRYGGGMKGKINEAMSHGVPVVSTSIGAQGFDAKNNIHMIIEDDPIQFAKSVVELLENPFKQRKIGLAGQKLNQRICSPEVIEARINELLNSILTLKSKKKHSVKASQYMFNFIWKLKQYLKMV